MQCIHCGARCPDDAQYCPRCGKPVQRGNEREVTPTIQLGRGEMTLNGASHEGWRADIRSGARWIRRIALPLVALAWIALIAVFFWAAAHIGRSLVLLAIAAVLAFALAPAVKLLQRGMPRFIAILVTYIIVFSALSLVIYFLTRAAVIQVSDLKNQVSALLQPGGNHPPTQLEKTLLSLGIDSSQIQSARQLLVSHLSGLVNDAVPVLRSIFEFGLDVIVVAMLSIYLLFDGARVMRWMRENLPAPQRKRGTLILDTLEHVVGGYIRGQLTLALLIGVLVGAGMFIFQVPHPILLGELAFFLAFVPVLGTFISGAACILLALTQTGGWVVGLTHQSWILAVIVLLYFVAMHLIESHIVGPRVVGEAVGLHPIVSITALIAGTELFGILGALFVAPVVGFFQAIIVAFWREWRAMHAEQFPPDTPTASSTLIESHAAPVEQEPAT